MAGGLAAAVTGIATQVVRGLRGAGRVAHDRHRRAHRVRGSRDEIRRSPHAAARRRQRLRQQQQRVARVVGEGQQGNLRATLALLLRKNS